MHYTSRMHHLKHACLHINGRIDICSDKLGVGHNVFRLEWIGYAAQCKGRRPRPHAPVLAVPEVVHEMPWASDVAAEVSAHVGNVIMYTTPTTVYMIPCMCTWTTIHMVCRQMQMYHNTHGVQTGANVSQYTWYANRGIVGVCRYRIGRPSRRARRYASLCI